MSRIITVLGLGALGSHLVLLLRNIEATLRCVDFDRVEQKNVPAQFHGKKSVGKSKVQSIQQTMQFLFGLKVEVIPHQLRSDNQVQLLGGSDLILDCLDNIEGRKLVSNFAREAGIPCLHGATAADGQFARVIWDKDFVPDEESVKGAPTCEGGEHLPFINIVAGYMAYSAQRFIADGEKAGFQIHPGGVTPV